MLTTTEVDQPEMFSVLMFGEDWDRLTKLLLAVGLATMGCIGNILIISSIMVDTHLKKSCEYSIRFL